MAKRCDLASADASCLSQPKATTPDIHGTVVVGVAVHCEASPGHSNCQSASV